MAVSKRQDSRESQGLRQATIFSGPAGVTSAVIAAMVLFVLIVVGVVYGWRRWGQTVVARPIYRVQSENIQVTSPPAWIRTDVRAEIVRDGGLDDLTIFDKDATIRVFQAFELHPWVSKVLRVSKHPPARLIVDLEYRQPVAWVEVPGAKPGDDGGVIPIDSMAYVLPSRDFTKDNLKDYLRISIRDVRPYGLAGTAWGDSRVVGAAKIASVLQASWQSLHLYRIQMANDSGLGSSPARPIYELETVSNRRILWGSGPGMEASEEPPASVKLNRLLQLAESNGSLETLPAEGIDLRNANRLQTANAPLRERSNEL